VDLPLPPFAGILPFFGRNLSISSTQLLPLFQEEENFLFPPFSFSQNSISVQPRDPPPFAPWGFTLFLFRRFLWTLRSPPFFGTSLQPCFLSRKDFSTAPLFLASTSFWSRKAEWWRKPSPSPCTTSDTV